MRESSKHWIYLLGIIVGFMTLANSCKKTEDTLSPSPTSQIPQITTSAISNITQIAATCGGTVISQGSSQILSKGVCWSTLPDPTIQQLLSFDGSGSGKYTSNVAGLSSGTLYYVRAYATNSFGTGYGNQVSFTTKTDTSGTFVTIDWLKNWYKDNQTADTLKITSDFVIEAFVRANDESGNIYKMLYLQDNTGGIGVNLDQTSLYISYPVGKKILIKCKDLYLGTWGTAIQLGYIYQGKIGRIPNAMINLHLFNDGATGQPPQPIVMNAGHLPPIAALDNLVSSLVAINSVKFPDAGQPFVFGNLSTSRPIADSTGTPITNPTVLVVYTSQYANFSSSLLPYGVGTLRGILMVYNGKFEMLVRDTTDLIDFHIVK